MWAILPGTFVKLRKDVLEFVNLREWEFFSVCKGVLLLKDKEKGNILEVKAEDIDWEEGY